MNYFYLLVGIGVVGVLLYFKILVKATGKIKEYQDEIKKTDDEINELDKKAEEHEKNAKTGITNIDDYVSVNRSNRRSRPGR